MRANIPKSILVGLTLGGLLLCGSARSQIALHDGGTNLTATAGQRSVTIPSFTVTSGASVLVVSVYARNNGPSDTLTNTINWGSQTLVKAAAQNNGNATYAQSDVYYLFSPLPGTSSLMCYDGGPNTPNGMSMQAYTLSGVDTNTPPVPYTSNAGGSTTANTVSVTLGAGTPFFAWALFSSSYGSANVTMTASSTSGTAVGAYGANQTSQLLGYVANLNAGNGTISVNVPGGSQKMSLAVAVFAPYLPGPAAPTLTAVTGETNKVDLSWNDESGLGATSYIVWRQVGAGNWTSIVTNSGGGNVAYTDNNVAPYVAYNYLVQAVSTAGAGPFSAAQPATPVGLPMTPTGVAVAGVGNSAVLTWTTATGAASYSILRSTTSGSETLLTSGVTGTTYTDSPLTLLAHYYYKVQAVNDIGTTNSVEVSVIPLSAPNSLVATAQTNRVALSWADTTAGLASSYSLQSSLTSGSGYLTFTTLNGNGSTSFTDHSVYDGTTYYYVVEAVSSNATSAASVQASATPFFALPGGAATSVVKPDGGTNAITTVANGAGSTISSGFTVSSGAHALVVELWDKNTFNNGSSPQSLTWVVGTTTNILTRAVSRSSAATTYSDCDIYYVYNPQPGAGTISGTDTNAVTIQGLSIMAFTLRGVDTTVPPVTYSAASASATTLSITTASVTPSNAYAAVLSYDANAGQAITQTSTTGSSVSKNVNNNDQQCLGYVSGLRAGASTITTTGAGGATKCTLAVAVFMPAVPTPIAILDGSIYTVADGGGSGTVTMPFSVSAGATALTAALGVLNNNNPFPTNILWVNNTLGVTQNVTAVASQWAGYGQIHPNVHALIDPLPGNGYLTATIPSGGGTASHMFLQAYTIVGVDTAIPTAVYGAGTESTLPAGVRTNYIAVNLSSSTMLNSWAEVCTYDNGGNLSALMTIGCTNAGLGVGTVVTTNFNPNVLCTAGYVSNLPNSACTVSGLHGVSGAADALGINVAVFSPLVLVPALSAPTNLVALSQTNQVALSWNDSSGGLANSFILLRSITSGSGFVPLATLSGTTTNYLDMAVYDGTTYYYVVEAVNNAGISPPSNQASATPVYALPAGFSGNMGKVDGGTAGDVTTVASGAGASLNPSFNVSAGASVLVVELWDKNTLNNNSSPAFMTWTTANSTQTLVRAISQVSGAATYSDCNIYYCFNPAQGSGTISGTDTNAVTIQGLTMLPFTLSGVDTTVMPLSYGANSASATTLQVSTSVRTPPGAWAAVMSYSANGGANITQSSTSGSSTYQNVNNTDQQALGYVSGLAGGSGTISMTHAGAANSALAVAVFMPAIGTGIALHDGSIFSTGNYPGVTTVAQNFSVSQGASAMVVALYDNNNTGPAGPAGPNLVWSNTTFGTVQPLTLVVQANTTAYTWTWADLYCVMDPLPGPGVVIGTDTNASDMFIEVYTLSGVDTTVAPAGYNAGNGGASMLSVDTDPSTVAQSWAPVIAVNYNGGGGNDVVFSATSGTVLANNFRPNGLQCTMGYLSNLGSGDTTITATGTGVATHMSEGAMVLTPLSALAAPTGLTATGQTNRIRLSWSDGSGGLATSYVLLRSLTSGHGYTAIATNVGVGSTTYLDNAVTDWTPYYYVVQAYGAGGISLYSGEATAYAVGLPAAVTGLSAFGNIYSVDLSWNTELGADLYRVQRSTTSGSGFSPIGTSSTGTFTDPSVTPGTLYYYIVTASNLFGFGANSGQASAVPVVTFFTNWVGIFNGDPDVAPWTVLSGSPSIYFYGDTPPSGPSGGAMLIDANFGPGTTADLQGAQKPFSVNLNVSTYTAVEMDIKNEGAYDDYQQIQAIQLNLQVPVGGNPTYERGTFGDIVLLESGTGSSWTHYSAPLNNWSAYDLTGVSAFGINIFDANCVAAAKDLVVAFANIEFTGAPGWRATISANNRASATGSTSVLLTGRVSGTVAGTNVYLYVNTPVSVTINGSTQETVINDATGDFSINFNTTGFANGVYPVTYTSASDMVALIGATNASTTLTLAPPPPRPTILPPSVDSTHTNLVLRVGTQSGWNYYLLSTTDLRPPVVWSTNSVTLGTGGTITNLVPISSTPPASFFRYVIR